MAKLFNGKIAFASALQPTGAQPLDDRTVVQSLVELLAADTFVVNGASAAYNGMIVSVLDEQKSYMLVNKDDISNEESWVAVGSGNGSVAVETYAEAIALATNDNIGQVIYVKTKSSYDADGEGEGEAIEYDAAPYIVIGEGQLQKLAASTASGDLDSDVAELKTKVSTIEGEIDALQAADTAMEQAYKKADADIITGYTDADAALKTELESAIAEKVAQTDFETEVTKLETTISENDTKAQGYANDAKAAAIAAAATDASTKANAAEQNAKDYADSLNEAMEQAYKDADAAIVSGYTAADVALKTELESAIAEKVDSVEGYRLMSNEEGTKLAGVDANAQVNKIEVVKVNGVALTISESDKSVDVIVPTAPVQGVADGEQIISLDGDKLKSTLTLAYVPATETENAVLRLQGINGQVISSIDATAFVKDGMVSGVKLDSPKDDETGEKYLSLTFNTDAGKEEIRMDVSDLIDYYVAGDGLNLSDGKSFSIKIDTTANEYLQVTTNGIAVSENLINKVIELDNAVLAAAATDASTKANAAQAAAIAAAATDASTKANTAEQNAKDYADGLDEAMNERVEALEAIDHEHENKTVLDGITAEKVTAWDAAEQNAKDYADGKFVTKEGFNEFEAEYEEKLNGIAAGAEVNVIESIEVNGVEATISEDKAASVKINANQIELGEAITGKDNAPIYEADTKISTVLQGINDSIRAAVAGGVNSVVAGDNVINVNNADPNNPKVSLNTEASTEETVANGHIELIKGENGIYAAMYYDGDDVE